MGDSFVDLERHRLQLEQNVAKLRASLQHWQAWEIEYEGMKEEIQGLDSDNRQDELVKIVKKSKKVQNDNKDNRRKNWAQFPMRLSLLVKLPY